MIAALRSVLSGDGMKARALRSTALSVIGFGSSQVIRLASNLVLTRILFPEAFGLMALVMVVLAALEMFSDVAISPSVIRSPRGDDPTFLDTAWTLQIIRGVILWLAACLLANPIASFYEQPELAAIIPVLGFTTVVRGFQTTRMYQVNRQLTIGRVTLVEVLSQVLGTLFMIGLAFGLQSVWALVFGSLMLTTLKTVFAHLLVPGQPNRIGWDSSAFWEIFHFGKYIFLGSIAGFFIQEGDRMILGKFVSLADLALYTIAFMLASVPLLLSSQLLERVLFPLYSRRPPWESPENQRRIGQARLMLTTGSIGLAGVFAVISVVLVEVLYDPRYHGAGPVLVLLSLAMVPRLILASYDKILLASGNSRDFTILTTGAAVLKVFALLIMIDRYGLVGAALASAMVDILIYPLLVYYIRPYRGWFPAQDVLLVLLGVLAGVAAFWLNPGVLEILPGWLGGGLLVLD